MGGVSPGSIANSMPPAEDDQARRSRDLARAQREQAAARSLEASQIGEGGLTVSDGGSITIEDGGDLYVDGDAIFNGNLTVPDGTLNTAGNIEAGGTLQGANLVSTGGATIAGTLGAGAVSATTVSGGSGVFNGGLRSTDVHSHLLTYGGAYTATWCHVDGTIGTVPSSREFKRDIETWAGDPALVSYLRVVTYRYIQAVENLGDDAETDLGLIAEEVHDLGLHWLVAYRLRLTDAGKQTPVPYMPEGEWVPFTVRYERISLVLLMWAQNIEERLAAAGI